MPANDNQVGGDHYAKAGAVQHWDTMIMEGVPYIIGCPTKYVCRWRSKNGEQDLKKSIHYLEKYKENVDIVNMYWRTYFKPVEIEMLTNWTDGHDEAVICHTILNMGGLSNDNALQAATRAQEAIRHLIEDFGEQPTAEQLHPR